MPRYHSHRSSAAPLAAHSRSWHAQVWGAGFTVVLIGSLAGAAGSPLPAEEETRLAPVRDEPLTQYRALRRMHAACEKFNQEGWVDAWTEFDGRTFRYEIVHERGSERVRERVLKAILKREQELIAQGKSDRSALTSENYEFESPTVQEPGARYILLKPKRKDVLLVDGRMVLTADGSDVVRVEGRLAKNPSFWTSLVNVIRHYGRINGVRVPIATESTAKVKLAGASRLEVRYEYESINNQPVTAAPQRGAAGGAR